MNEWSIGGMIQEKIEILGDKPLSLHFCPS
jgi:hypothetical protein